MIDITIREQEIFPERNAPKSDDYIAYREAVKALVLNSEGEFAFTFSPEFNGRNGGYSLPGGGIETGESQEEALIREMREGVGCDIQDISVLGTGKEFSLSEDSEQMLQKTFYFSARVKGAVGEVSLTASEKERGLTIKWLSLATAKREFESTPPSIARVRALALLAEIK
jgi:ADP-ribose pyrophosphatase YjhB (NUDIX family)